MRLRDLLGVSLDELKELMEAEEARAALRSEWQTANPDLPRRRQIVDEALGHLDHQMRLVRRRKGRAASERVKRDPKTGVEPWNFSQSFGMNE